MADFCSCGAELIVDPMGGPSTCPQMSLEIAAVIEDHRRRVGRGGSSATPPETAPTDSAPSCNEAWPCDDCLWPEGDVMLHSPVLPESTG